MYAFRKTRFIDGNLDYSTENVNGLYLARDEALADARRWANYWKYNYAVAPDVAHASYMETPQGATILVELKDGRNILTYFEVTKEAEQ